MANASGGLAEATSPGETADNLLGSKHRDQLVVERRCSVSRCLQEKGDAQGRRQSCPGAEECMG